NDAFLRAVGGEKAEAINANDVGSVWADRNQLHEYTRILNQDGTVQGMEADFIEKDGSMVPRRISGALVELNGEQCVVSFTHSIADLKRTQRELIAAREAALASSRAKSE